MKTIKKPESSIEIEDNLDNEDIFDWRLTADEIENQFENWNYLL